MHLYKMMNRNGFFYGLVDADSERDAMKYVAIEICEYEEEEADRLINDGFFLAEQVA